jgi:hypothetical protein
MSYTREQAAAYITAEDATLFTDFGVSTDDNQAGIKSILDRALRAVGVPEAQLSDTGVLVQDADAYKLECALDYYALLRFSKEAAGRVQVSKSSAGNSVSKSGNQYADHIAALLKDAEARCASLGVLTGAASFEFGTLLLDYLEPDLSVN